MRTTLTCILLSAVITARVSALPTDFVDLVVAPSESFNTPVALDFAADGRIFVAEKGGRIYILEPDPSPTDPRTDYNKLTPAFFDLESEVLNHHDRGMLGFCLDPDFLNNGYIYVAYLQETDPGNPDSYQWTYAKIERYTVDGSNPNVIDMSSQLTLLGETWATGTVSAHLSHSTGTLLFGDDGTLLFSHGDGAHYDGAPDGGGRDPDQFLPGRSTTDQDVGAFRAQYHGSLSGKVLRLDPATGDGVPSNPYYDGLNPRSNESRIWAEGLRNPFRMGIHRGSGSTDPAAGNPGTLYIGDVGWTDREEMNRCNGGENFGWPCYEGVNYHAGFNALTPPVGGCPPDPSGFTMPLIDWPHGGSNGTPIGGYWGAASTGAAYYDMLNFPPPYRDVLFYCDYVANWIRVAYFDGSGNITGIDAFATGLDKPIDLRVDPHSGDLFYLGYQTSAIHRINFGGGTGVGLPPEMPSGFGAMPGSNRVELSWNANPELDIAGYNVYRRDAPGGADLLLTPTPTPDNSFVDVGAMGGISNGQIYYYSVEAIDAELPPLTSPRTQLVPAIPSAKTWEWYLPVPGPTLDFPELPSPMPMDVHVPFAELGTNFDIWTTSDRAPQLRRAPATSDWTLETRFTLTDYVDTSRFHTGLMVYFGQYDVFTWGPYRGTDLHLERTTVGGPGVASPNADTLSLRVVKTGDLYSFEWRVFDTDPWTVGTTRTESAPALLVGALTKTWASDVSVDVHYEYLAINELPPVAASSSDVNIGATPLDVQFSSSGSFDPDGDILTHSWDFGDGNGSTEADPAHSYTLPGSYQAVLTVRDGAGFEAVAPALAIEAEGNRPPTASISAPLDGYEYTDASAPITLTGVGGDVEDPPASLSYDWSVDLQHGMNFTANWIDPPSQASTSFVPNTVDDGSGIWLDIILTVTDSGGLSAADTVRVYDRVLPPVGVLDLQAALAGGSGPRAGGSADSPWVELAGGHDAALLGFDLPGASSGWAGAGLLGDPYRIELDGVDDRLAVAAASVPELLGNTGASVELWFRTGSEVVSRQYLIEWLESFSTPFPGMTLALQNGRLQMFQGSWLDVAGLVPDRWYHLICTKDASGFRAFLDGELVVSDANANLGDANSEIVLGAGTFPGPGIHADHYQGAFGEIRVYDFALSDANVFVLTSPGSGVYANAPRIGAITPATAPNDELLSMALVDGLDFVDGATAWLERSGESDIAATNVQRLSGAQLQVDIDLTGAAVGDWDLVVQNPDGQQAVAAAALEVTPPDPLFLELLAAQADGVLAPIVPGSASPWVDLRSGHLADLSGFAGDAGSGWQGDGSGADPYSLRFDGVDDVVALSAASIPELQGATDLTVDLWLRPGADLTTTQTVVEWCESYFAPWPGLSVVIEGGELYARFSSPTELSSFGAASSEWTHVGLAYTDSLVFGYRDGSPLFVNVLSDGVGDQLSELVLGASTRSGVGVYGEFWGGDIAVLRIEDRFVEAPEFAARYATELASFQPEPIATVALMPSSFVLPEGGVVDLGVEFDDGGIGQGLRGASVTISYDPAYYEVLSVTEGGLLQAAGATFFSGDAATPGLVQIDASLLGSSVSAVSSGTLATVQLGAKAGAPEGASALTIDPASQFVDLGNPPQDLSVVCSGSSGVLDFSAPSQVSSLAALAPAPPQLGVSWTPPGGDYSAAHVFYRPWSEAAGSGYPEYATAAPAWPADIDEARDPANGWTELVVPAGTNTASLSHAERTVLSVVVCAEDAVANISSMASAPRLRTANYRLGDLGQLDAAGQYVANFDGAVSGMLDLPVLSKAYGLSSVDAAWIPEADVGPTSDSTPIGVPQPDDVVDFEDLMIFSQDFPSVNKSAGTLTLGPRSKVSAMAVRTGAGPFAEDSRVVELPLQLEGNRGDLKGLSLEFSFDPEQLGFVEARRSPALQRAGAPLLFLARVDAERGRLTLDLVALGGDVSLSGDGSLGSMRFELKSQLGGALTAVRAEARSVRGKPLELDSSELSVQSLTAAPLSYRLLPNAPNPFNPTTVISLETPRSGPASLRVYDLSGRLVDILFDGDLPAGYHDFAWNGRDQRGRSVASGTYLYELRAPETRFVKKMMLLK